MNKSGFTLAEVLITLVIIGVIAAIIVPIMFYQLRNQELESRFKKTSSELQQALTKVKFDEGMTIYNNINQTGGKVAKILIKQFSKPATIINRGDILSKKIKNKAIQYTKFDGSEYNYATLDDGTIIVNDSFFIYINNDNYLLTNQEFIIDTNGFKGPNREGYDLFKYCLRAGDKIDYNCSEYSKRAVMEKDYFKNLPSVR